MEPDEFRKIYDRYGPLAWSIIARAGVPERDREDVFMESWEAIFASLGSFAGRSSLATWIGKIVRNKAVDRRRRAVPVPISDGDLLSRVEAAQTVAGHAGGCEVIRRESAALLKGFIGKLSPERRLIVGKWLDGLSYRAIADLVAIRGGRPADTNYVGRELYLAKARLAELLAEARIDSLEDIWE